MRLKKFFKKRKYLLFFSYNIIFSLDRITKLGIINNYSERSYYVNDFINFDLIWNGIGFGFLSTQSTLLYNVITVIIFAIVVILFFFLINSKKLDKLIFCINNWRCNWEFL